MSAPSAVHAPDADASRRRVAQSGRMLELPVNYVDNLWSLFAVLALTGVFQLFFAATWVVIGGLGGQWRVNQALARQATELSNLEHKVSREQKVRAGEKRQEGPREAKTLAIEAAELLAANQAVTAPQTRPSTISLINGGGRK